MKLSLLTSSLIMLLGFTSATLVPKQVLKHGLITFIQDIAQPTKDNLCFVVFENYVEAVLDDQMDFDEAFETAFHVDLTQTYAKGTCGKAFAKFQDLWKPYSVKNNKVCCKHSKPNSLLS